MVFYSVYGCMENFLRLVSDLVGQSDPLHDQLILTQKSMRLGASVFTDLMCLTYAHQFFLAFWPPRFLLATVFIYTK